MLYSAKKFGGSRVTWQCVPNRKSTNDKRTVKAPLFRTGELSSCQKISFAQQQYRKWNWPIQGNCRQNCNFNTHVRCKTNLNSFPRRKLDETTGTSSYYMDENHSAASEIQQPQYGWRSWLGSEPSTPEIDVYVWRYALLVVLARNDDDGCLI